MKKLIRIAVTLRDATEALKLCEHSLFRKYKQNVVLLVFYLYNYDSPKLTLFMQNMTSLDDILSTAFVK